METFSRGTLESELDPWYVTGFAEGQGTFTYSRNGRQLSLYFAVKVTAADEPVLLDIRDYFGVGTIYFVQPRAAYYYRVCRREQLPVVLAHFDTYPLRGGKLDAYRIWREMVVLKQRFRRPQRDELDSLATQLSASNRP